MWPNSCDVVWGPLRFSSERVSTYIIRKVPIVALKIKFFLVWLWSFSSYMRGVACCNIGVANVVNLCELFYPLYWCRLL